MKKSEKRGKKDERSSDGKQGVIMYDKGDIKP